MTLLKRRPVDLEAASNELQSIENDISETDSSISGFCDELNTNLFDMSNYAENKTPKLRFNEFQESWSKEVLGDISKISKGKGISKSQLDENGQTKCILFGQLYTTYNEIISNVVSKTSLPAEGLVLSKSNDVIIPCSGETHIDIARASCVKDDNIALGGDLSIIRSKNNGFL